MSSQGYQVVLRLCSPMHIGQTKIGNIQRTRPYVTGRVLWGAFTARLTRDLPHLGADYKQVGKRVTKELAFTYFYPTTDPGHNVISWPWDEGRRPCFLSSYASTALSHPYQSAEEGTLHEVEFISPRTLNSGEQVYLTGYIFAQERALDWRSSLPQLQLGGERGYGWGRVEPAGEPQPLAGRSLFNGMYTIDPNKWPPLLIAGGDARLLAHALAADFEDKTCHLKNSTPTLRRCVGGVSGPVEPLVGRETCSDGRFGVQVSEARICYVPGSTVTAGTRMQIGPYGIWEAAQ